MIIPGLLNGSAATPDWRSQMQQTYGSGLFGGHQGSQAFVGPSTMQAYAMSNQARFANPPAGGSGGVGGQGGQGNLQDYLVNTGGGGLADMVRAIILRQQQQQQGGGVLGSGGQVTVPSRPSIWESY